MQNASMHWCSDGSVEDIIIIIIIISGMSSSHLTFNLYLLFMGIHINYKLIIQPTITISYNKVYSTSRGE